ncbi:unnamed protein product [Durusdinium trenchii]|uniref:Uncharacterized protein n=2 Tax=Durusdinium trenchii TaxID=1381693 RepID=A0ABP0IBQ8_9DINO
MQQKHAEPSDDLQESAESPSSAGATSPDFGQPQILVTPASDVTGLPTPDFGNEKTSESKASETQGEEVQRSVDSPKFGFAVPPSPDAEWDTLKLPEVDSGHGDQHPSTPDFGSLGRHNPFLDLGSAASSPQASRENSPEHSAKPRLSVDMLLPSPSSPSREGRTHSTDRNVRTQKVSDRKSPDSKTFDFEIDQQREDGDDLEGHAESAELLQECFRLDEELQSKKEMLKWFYQELEATSAKLETSRTHLEESQASRSELAEELDASLTLVEKLEGKLERLHAQEHSSQVFEDHVNEAKELQLSLQNEENICRTLRFEHDDLASELRDFREKLCDAQRTAEEASKLRICKHEAATLGEALEKAEAALRKEQADSFERAAALRTEDSDLFDELAHTQAQLKQSRLDSAQRLAEMKELEDSSAKEMFAAMQALAESNAEVEAATASEWKADAAFEQLADMSRELSDATARAGSESEQHAAILAASKAHAEMETAKMKQQLADLAAQLQVADSKWKNAEARLAVTESCSGTSNMQREGLLEARIHDLEVKLLEVAASKQSVESRLDASEARLQQLQSNVDDELLAKRAAEVRLAQVEKSSKSLDMKLAMAAECEQDAEVHLTQAEEMSWDLQRQLERESRSRGSVSMRLQEAEQEAESTGRKLALALAARQAAESRLSAEEVVFQQLEASLAHAETTASSRSQNAVSLKAELHERTMRLETEIQAQKASEAQTRKLQDSLRDLEAKLESAITAREDVDAALKESQRFATKMSQELISCQDAAKAELASYQIDGKVESASQVQAKVLKQQEMSERLQSEVADETKLAATYKALAGTLEMEVETEKQGREQAQEAFGKAKDSANSLECQLAAASAMAERLKAHQDENEQSDAKSSAALSLAREEQAEQQLEINELRQELLLARQQRRAALQASERAQMARVKQQQQAVSLRKRSEQNEAARSASITSLIEENGALVREQHGELLSEIKVCQAVLASRAVELSKSQDECSNLKLQVSQLVQKADGAEKLAESEQQCCRVLLQQLEDMTLQSIESAARSPQVLLSRTDVAKALQLRDELAALQVCQLQSEAAAVRRQLAVGGACFAATVSGGDPIEHATPLRRTLATPVHMEDAQLGEEGQVSALPLSASVGSVSPLSSLQANSGSQCPLPWGPPPTKVQDLLFSASSSPVSSRARER